MSKINEYVSVNISRKTTSVTKAGFGTALIWGTHSSFAEDYKIYTSSEDVAVDFEATTPIYIAANALFSQDIRPDKVVIGKRVAADPVATGLAALNYDDWYALVLIREGAEAAQLADIESAAGYVEGKEKIFLCSSDQSTILTSQTTDIASVLSGANYTRTALMYSASTAKYPEAAWLGCQLPKDPGSTTWKFKTLNGIPADSLSSSETTNADGKKCNYYLTVAGNNIIASDATMASGEYIDIIRGIDWLKARISEGVFGILLNTEKIPYTDQGIALITSEIRYWLQEGVEQGILIEDSIHVDAPKVIDIDSNQKLTRILNGISFGGKLSGAVHTVKIQGTLSV